MIFLRTFIRKLTSYKYYNKEKFNKININSVRSTLFDNNNLDIINLNDLRANGIQMSLRYYDTHLNDLNMKKSIWISIDEWEALILQWIDTPFA